MRTRLMAVVAAAAAMFTGTLYAITASYTEKVDGLTWHYQIENGKARICNGTEPAAQDREGNDPVGALAIPSKLGGKPVAAIGDNAFSDCDYITSVTIPATVTTIGDAAFNGCDGLTSVKIPDSVTAIGEGAFSGCDSLKCVDFGKKVAFIGAYAFADCELLRSLVFRGNEPTVGVDAFDEVAPECMVYVSKSGKNWPTGSFVVWEGMELVVDECVAPVEVHYYDLDMAGYGTVTGGGDFAVGKKITLKATPAKNCVFGGWYDMTSGGEELIGYSQSLSYTVTGADDDIAAKFYTAGEDFRDFEVESDDYRSDDDGYVWIKANGGCLIVYTCSEPKLSFKGLPPGVKYDAKKLALYGKATKPGKYTVTVTGTNKSVKRATDSDNATCEFEIAVPNFVDDEIEVDDVYPNEIGFIPGGFTIYTISGAEGCSVSGLPAGMKWTAKDIVDSKTKEFIPANSVYGAPTKAMPRESTVFFTKTVNGVKHTATSTFVVDSFRVLQIDTEGAGSVSGADAYAANANVKLTAKPEAEWVFNGWYEDGELLSQSPSYTYVMGLYDTTLKAKFVSTDVDRLPKNTKVTAEDVVAGVSEEISMEGGNSVLFHCGVYVNWHLDVEAPSATTVKVSKLPAGLKFTTKDIYKKGSKTEVEVKANSIYGVPTKDGDLDVTITVTTAGKNSFYYDVFMVVHSIKALGWAVGQFYGAIQDEETDIGGMSSFTVTEAGKISGKYVAIDGKTWTLSAPYFDYSGYDGDGLFFLHATIACKSGSETAAMQLLISEPERFEDGFIEPWVAMAGELGYGESYLSFWKDEPWKSIGQKINKQSFFIGGDYEAEDLFLLTVTLSSDGSAKAVLNYNNYKPTCSSVLSPLQWVPDEDDSFLAHVVLCFPKNEKAKFAGYAHMIMVKWDGKTKKFEVQEED